MKLSDIKQLIFCNNLLKQNEDKQDKILNIDSVRLKEIVNLLEKVKKAYYFADLRQIENLLSQIRNYLRL